MSTDVIGTVVIGGGQAGLAAGYHLSHCADTFIILEGAERLGESWRRRWDSLRLFTPAGFSHLPGLAFPADRGHFPTKDEMADYLQAYADHFDLPVQLGARATELHRVGDRFAVTTGDAVIEAHQVIVATGSATHPWTPEFAADLDPGIRQLHSTGYRNPDQVQGPVLVVGAGNSGAEIAVELAGAGHQTWLAGRDTGRLPFRPGGALFRTVNRQLTTDTRLGRRLAARMSGGGTPLVRVRAGDLAAVTRTVRIIGARDGRPLLLDGGILEPATVIWCTGFTDDYTWITLPVLGPDGTPRHRRGVVEAQPGLFFLGLPFLSSIASPLVGGVGADARHLATIIESRRRRRHGEVLSP